MTHLFSVDPKKNVIDIEMEDIFILLEILIKREKYIESIEQDLEFKFNSKLYKSRTDVI